MITKLEKRLSNKNKNNEKLPRPARLVIKIKSNLFSNAAKMVSKRVKSKRVACLALPMNGSRSRRLCHFCITVFERTESNTLQGFHVKDVSVFQTKAEKKSLCFDQFHYDQFHPAKAISQISSYYNDVSPYYPDCHEGTVKKCF